MNRYFQNIREKTGGMNTGQKIEYILTYYWYHILGLLVLIFLPVFFWSIFSLERQSRSLPV